MLGLIGYKNMKVEAIPQVGKIKGSKSIKAEIIEQVSAESKAMATPVSREGQRSLSQLYEESNYHLVLGLYRIGNVDRVRGLFIYSFMYS